MQEQAHKQHGHSHGHTHSHEHTRAVVNRLSRAIGHLEAVKRMAEEERDCSELLVQLAAVRSALTSTGKVTSPTASWTRWNTATRKRWRR